MVELRPKKHFRGQDLPRLRFDRTPEWRTLVEKAFKLKEQGMDVEHIATTLKADPHAVMRILEDENEAKQYATRTWNEKIPTIKNIIGLSLNALNETLKDIAVDDSLRKIMLAKVSDIAQLTKVVVDLNMLLRLELNQSTENKAISHQHSYEQTRVALQELKKVDPIFEYTALPEKKIDG